MLFWIRKIAFILALIVLVIVFLVSIDYNDPLNELIFFFALMKAAIAALIFWFLTFIICDIIVKGITDDIPSKELDLFEGGIIQRIHTIKKKPQVYDIDVDKKKDKSSNDNKQTLDGFGSKKRSKKR